MPGSLSRFPWRLAASSGLLAVMAVVPTAASAGVVSVGPVYWVAPGGTPAGADTSCQTAAYSTVQSAVTAAEATEAQPPGLVPKVEVCPGTYPEQVTILASLVLTAAGSGPVTIQLPAAVGSGQSTGLSTTNCQARDAEKDAQVPQSVIEICAAGVL